MRLLIKVQSKSEETSFSWSSGHAFVKATARSIIHGAENINSQHKGVEPTVPVAGRSIWISTTSPSMISVSSLQKKINNHMAIPIYPVHQGRK